MLLPQLESILDKRLQKGLASKLREIDRVNFGCGEDFMEGWLNIALFVEDFVPYGTLVRTEKETLLLHFDATKALPLPDNHVQYLYASHFIEHLDFWEGLVFLRRCYRIMKKGGIIRLACPDLELWIKKYTENDTDFFNKYVNIYYKGVQMSKPPMKTKGEIFSSQICGFRHKWCYDLESIKDVMERTGFSNISQKSPGESLVPGIKKIELIDQGRMMESIYVEGEKP